MIEQAVQYMWIGPDAYGPWLRETHRFETEHQSFQDSLAIFLHLLQLFSAEIIYHNRRRASGPD